MCICYSYKKIFEKTWDKIMFLFSLCIQFFMGEAFFIQDTDGI